MMNKRHVLAFVALFLAVIAIAQSSLFAQVQPAAWQTFKRKWWQRYPRFRPVIHMSWRTSTVETLAAAGAVGLVMLLSGCTEPHDSTTPPAGKENRLAVHAASDERDGVFTVQKVGPEGELLFLAAKPLITDDDVRHASITTAADGRPAVLLELTDGGAEAVRSESGTYVGRNLVFLWDGDVVFAPRAQSPLGSRLMMVGGTDPAPSDWLDDVVSGLNVAASSNNGGG